MNKTRRIEITRYSRRVTLMQGSDATAEAATELSAIEVVTNVREVISSAPEEVNDGRLSVVESAAAQTSRRGPRFSLRDWLRRRW